MGPSKSQRLVVYRWEPRAPIDRASLPKLYDGPVELPDHHDLARKAAGARALGLSRGKRVRSCSALVGGGFSVIVEV